jgi:hypothetical protein
VRGGGTLSTVTHVAAGIVVALLHLEGRDTAEPRHLP